MPKHINLRQIEAFKAVIEHGTVSRAADMLNISQPAMSKLVAHLEFDTGLKLFDRAKGRLAPTEHAMRLYDEVGRIFAGVRQVESAVDAIRREEQGRLAIGVVPGLSGSFIQRALTSFLMTHSNVFCTVESITSQWVADWVITRKVDVGLVDAHVDNPYLIREPLMEHPLVCIMSPDHPLTSKRMIEPHDLDAIPFVAFSAADIGLLVQRTLDGYRSKPRTVLVSNAALTVCEFVAAGHGVSLVHPAMTTGLEHRLVARRFAPEVYYHLQLCRSADSRNAHLVEAFAQQVRATADDLSNTMLGER